MTPPPLPGHDMEPYKINISDKKLSQLRAKLELATFPEETPLSNDWQYGVPVTDIKRLVQYWQNGFDWRQQEKMLNSKLPQFTTTIEVEDLDPLTIHFVHQRSKRANAIPLLFCHGWPGSFIEVLKILPLLTDPEDDSQPAFHVIAPSLPGFGFSSAPTKPGFGIVHYAECLNRLMIQLGYMIYATQGGDWGFSITRFLGIEYPHQIIASHLNYVWASAPSLSRTPLLYLQSLFTPLGEKEKKGLERTKWFYDKGFAYNQLQTHNTATIGLMIRDSPVGLLTWIYEKLHDWTDDYPWTDDEILTWTSIYWFSEAGPEASVRIYYETTHPSDKRLLEYTSGVKLGLSTFPKDLIVSPKLYGRTLGPVVFEAVHEEGGHFAAYEKPELLVGDLRKMFGKGNKSLDLELVFWR
ncbi:alpha/beta-hydrolase [Podospora australis]|uniref:Alpha/beta-hydrolase n=1 Tax=Podospora australis TaxID=1536484 RepID=A0AAN7AE81_9PEZI|nr:alpha/beta-hydrolase [Podospora australis]